MKPWKVMEIWTWTQRVSRQAKLDPKWTATEPISIETGYDLRRTDGQNKMWAKLMEEAPDVVVMAFPCSPWSPLQNSQRDQERVCQKRREDVVFLRLALEIAQHQISQGRYSVIENPNISRAWTHSHMKKLRTECGEVVFQCALRGSKTLTLGRL